MILCSKLLVSSENIRGSGTSLITTFRGLKDRRKNNQSKRKTIPMSFDLFSEISCMLCLNISVVYIRRSERAVVSGHSTLVGEGIILEWPCTEVEQEKVIVLHLIIRQNNANSRSTCDRCKPHPSFGHWLESVLVTRTLDLIYSAHFVSILS